ncbi:MAG: hypothetical protein GX820_00160 [Bacteroidales bacterium]|nr:hypothetical protein [Bacteroidales bacterium]
MNIYEKYELINSLLYDLRAEYLVAGMLAGGITAKEITASFDGVLKRKWSADINFAEIEKYENGEEALNIHLNRAGIYDALPEALFHEFIDNRNATGEEMAKESMKLKIAERSARLFFRPFENAVFLQNVAVADKENRQLESLYSELLNGLTADFWLTDNIPSEYTVKLCRLLPLAHKIVGDYELTARCLESILDENVNIRLSDIEDNPHTDHNGSDIEVASLGNVRLGYDMIPGVNITGFIGKLQVIIGPVENTKITDYFKKGKAGLLLESFYGYFIPVELDVETKILINEGERNFIIGADDENQKSYLGYNTVI